MATIGQGSMDIMYEKGQNLDEVMRVSNKSKSSEHAVYIDLNGKPYDFGDVCNKWNISKLLMDYNNENQDTNNLK